MLKNRLPLKVTSLWLAQHKFFHYFWQSVAVVRTSSPKTGQAPSFKTIALFAPFARGLRAKKYFYTNLVKFSLKAYRSGPKNLKLIDSVYF
jgi:hypothetical protein